MALKEFRMTGSAADEVRMTHRRPSRARRKPDRAVMSRTGHCPTALVSSSPGVRVAAATREQAC